MCSFCFWCSLFWYSLFFVSSGNSVALALRPVPCATGARRVRVCVALPAAVPLDAIHGVVRIGS